MKVLHINSYYSVNKLYKNLYDKQIEQGIALDVFVPISSQKKQIDNDMGDYTTISVNHCEFDRYIFHMKHHKIYKDIKKTYNINEYSLIHAHSLFSNGYIAMKLKEKYNIPYVVAVRNTDVNVFFKKIFF
jgi:predicted RNA-binding protein (virulence factor B family)